MADFGCDAADYSDITLSQARDTRQRRMKEVNSLCTDSGPLRANTVLRHSTQYNLLVCCCTHNVTSGDTKNFISCFQNGCANSGENVCRQSVVAMF